MNFCNNTIPILLQHCRVVSGASKQNTHLPRQTFAVVAALLPQEKSMHHWVADDRFSIFDETTSTGVSSLP